MRLDGKIALVTGGGRGIGRAIAEDFIAEGASVVIGELDADLGEATAGEISATFMALDVRQEHQVKSVIDQVEENFGRLDVLVNNAGISGQAGDYDEVINVNQQGVYRCLLHGLPAIARGGGGSIVNIASIAGLFGGFGDGYTASKHAVIGLTKQWALNGAPFNVRVNAICPGWIETELTKILRDVPQVMENILKQVPIGRMAKPSEIAKAATWLASDDASYATGMSMVIDGGWSIDGGWPIRAGLAP
ncbi:MAG TPA: SDR family NAD(P)-dependent oxidoreductase [Dehalococcoidia bacterium]|nr:SDR family NAD(P)-dependent oxidoreductase [Dehalococcoidia bacterium]